MDGSIGLVDLITSRAYSAGLEKLQSQINTVLDLFTVYLI